MAVDPWAQERALVEKHFGPLARECEKVHPAKDSELKPGGPAGPTAWTQEAYPAEMKGRAYVRGELVSEAEMLAQIVRDRAPQEES